MAESKSGLTEIEQMYENVYPKLALVLLFVGTEVECGKGLLRPCDDSFGSYHCPICHTQLITLRAACPNGRQEFKFFSPN